LRRRDRTFRKDGKNHSLGAFMTIETQEETKVLSQFAAEQKAEKLISEAIEIAGLDGFLKELNYCLSQNIEDPILGISLYLKVCEMRELLKERD
jgi:hypothetical protein